jgi:hypothetical protein
MLHIEVLCEIMNSVVESYLKDMRLTYKEKNYDEIISLGLVTDKPVRINGKKYYPAAWGQEFQGQSLLVVQLTRWHIFKLFGSTDCIGFTLNREGTLKHVDANWLMNEVGHP